MPIVICDETALLWGAGLETVRCRVPTAGSPVAVAGAVGLAVPQVFHPQREAGRRTDMDTDGCWTDNHGPRTGACEESMGNYHTPIQGWHLCKHVN
eukprot:3328315-Amphidinium_carterae.2